MYKAHLLTVVLAFISLALFAQEATLQRIRIEQPMSVTLQHRLRSEGIELLEFLGGNDYLARVVAEPSGRKVRSVLGELLPFSAKEKIAPALLLEQREQVIVRLFLVANADLQQLRCDIENVGGVYLSYDVLLGAVCCTIPSAHLLDLARLNEVLWVHPLPPQRKIQDKAGKLMSDVPLVQHEGNATGLDLTGRGVRIGIWDETIDPHPDLIDKVSVQERKLQSTGHGTHVTGIILGAGFLNEEARGMSPQARAWSYNFKFEESEPDEWDKMQEAYKKYHISLTNNSYGVAYEKDDCSDYEQMVYDLDAPFDLLAQRYPYLTHVFAAGNERNNASCHHKFNNGYGSSPSRGKNLIYVGAITADKRMTSFSSWGPMDDGRLIPTVVAHGARVLSTDQSAGYVRLSGTSMACPAVTGQLALVTEYYARLHNNATPRSDLLRALVANTAEDMEPQGPDYATGYGVVNAAKMVEALGKQQYVLGDFSAQGEQKEYEIYVPDGTARIRVMLVWNDAVSLRPHAWGQKALVNDLDLTVKNGEDTFLPWILDPKNPARAAKRGEDHLNTIEQVTIDSPKRIQTVLVRATALPKPNQPYALVWYFEPAPVPAFLLPRVGERLGEHFTVKMHGLTPPIQLRMLNTQGTTMRFGSLVTLSEEIDLPMSQFDTLYLEATDVNARTVRSRKFVRLPVPRGIQLSNSTVNPDGFKLTWQKVNIANAQFRYSICIACSADDNWQEIDQVGAETDEYEIVPAQLFGATQVAIAVRVVLGKAVGRLSEAVLTPSLPPRTDATVCTQPSLHASIYMFNAALPLEEGARVSVNSLLTLRIHTVAERLLERLVVHGEDLPFTDAGDGNYTAIFQIPTQGLYKNFCFEAQTVPAPTPPSSVTLRYDSTRHLGLEVLEEGVVRRSMQKLRRGTWLTIQCVEKGTKHPEYFMVNGVRLDGTYNDKKLEAKYHLPATYSLSDLEIDCYYTDLPSVPFTAHVYGAGAMIEYVTNGTPLLPNDACACEAILSIRVQPAARVRVEKVVCNGVSLKLDEQEDIVVAEYLVPSIAEVSAVHAEIYLTGSPTDISATWGDEIQVFPNPFAEQLRIKNDEWGSGTYKLFSATGAIIRAGRLCGKEEMISTDDLPVGLYLLHIVSLRGDTRTFRLMKE